MDFNQDSLPPDRERVRNGEIKGGLSYDGATVSGSLYARGCS